MKPKCKLRVFVDFSAETKYTDTNGLPTPHNTMKKIVYLVLCVFILSVDGIGLSTASAQLFPRLNRQPICVQQPTGVQPQQVQLSETQQARKDRTSASNRAIVDAKTRKIQNEIARLKNHPWAGVYSTGAGLEGFTLTLAPENGFTVIDWSDIGRYDQNHGTVDWDGDRIKLSLAFAVDSDTTRFARIHASEYILIRWGERVYLVPPDQMMRFVNDVNSMDAVNSGRAVRPGIGPGGIFLRSGDDKKAVSGKPELPEEFMPYLLDAPINVTIVSVKDIREEERQAAPGLSGTYRTNVATIVIDKGKKDGLLADMQLWIIEPVRGSAGGRVKLTRVEETQSEGEYMYFVSPASDAPSTSRAWEIPRTPPEPGWRLSTHQPRMVTDPTEVARQTAIQKFIEVKGRDSLQNYNITVRESPEEWSVWFEGKIPAPGNHNWVNINKATGAVKFFHGQ